MRTRKGEHAPSFFITEIAQHNSAPQLPAASGHSHSTAVLQAIGEREERERVRLTEPDTTTVTVTYYDTWVTEYEASESLMWHRQQS